MMKRMLFLAAAGIVILAGCTGVKTLSAGMENEAFVVLVGEPNSYQGGVDVSIGDAAPFKAEVSKPYTDRPKGKVYAIPTGTHVLTVAYGGSVIFQKQIFVSAQETKKITLP